IVAAWFCLGRLATSCRQVGHTAHQQVSVLAAVDEVPKLVAEGEIVAVAAVDCSEAVVVIGDEDVVVASAPLDDVIAGLVRSERIVAVQTVEKVVAGVDALVIDIRTNEGRHFILRVGFKPKVDPSAGAEAAALPVTRRSRSITGRDEGCAGCGK